MLKHHRQSYAKNIIFTKSIYKLKTHLRNTRNENLLYKLTLLNIYYNIEV